VFFCVLCVAYSAYGGVDEMREYWDGFRRDIHCWVMLFLCGMFCVLASVILFRG
jgi:hypothetical protein